MNPAAPRVAASSRTEATGVAPYLSPGQRIADRYEVLGVLGEGGMGVVYRCRDASGELLAVKRVVLPEANADEHLGWFLAEAQALAGLSHENIVRARDFGQLRDGTPYLAMDLAQGVSLQQVILEPVPLALLWLLTDQILAALSHAHARGVVHGDLKPSNLVVEDEGHRGPRVRLFDFGLAKRCRGRLDPRLGQTSAPSHPPPSAGTPGYMAPEQILGRRSEICAATDLYALGCILYRALSGRAPFVQEKRHELDFHCFREPARLKPVTPIPDALVDFVMSLLQKRPGERASSAAEVRAEWREFQPTPRHDPASLSVRHAAKRAVGHDLSTGAETTRRLSPYPQRASTLKLRRSTRWLPGLLSIRPSPLVGRTGLCRLLLESFRAVLESAVPAERAIVLTGPAGVGKSRLLDWLCTEVEEEGSGVVLRGFRANPATARDGLAVALADRYGLGGGALRMLPAALARRCSPEDLGTVVDWILRCVDPVTANPAGPDCQRGANALLRVLGEIAGSRPLLLWLDDPTEVSPETLALFAALKRSEPPLRILVVTSARPETLSKAAAIDTVRALRASLETQFVSVPVLDSLTTSALLRAAHPVDSALALQIALDSHGVPLDALSRLFALAKRGRVG